MKSPNCRQLKGFDKVVCRPPLVVLGLRWPPLVQVSTALPCMGAPSSLCPPLSWSAR